MCKHTNDLAFDDRRTLIKAYQKNHYRCMRLQRNAALAFGLGMLAVNILIVWMASGK